ncbi:sensor histidine kinase [Mariniflexile sp. AS56]|uniref:sensor histidine kinase n=1 Tax=Mariniflexile sp. AS56 TaxID=3063957 RepID=UPI0026E9E0C0|nr:ATP-binding protein [Mariniflexile sp. AS56]MDO7171815.1 ATP-binding protein [Mariniflexile sp. AS56]
MRIKLGLDIETFIGSQLADILTSGSQIFYQTHFYPLLKMQKSAREIFMEFKSPNGPIPVLLNIEINNSELGLEMVCGGMEISGRNRYEKELIEAKKVAEQALVENIELKKTENALLLNQRTLESQLRKLKLLKEQQQQVFKLISHDLQEPLRKTILYSDYIGTKVNSLPESIEKGLSKLVTFSTQMSDMLLTLLHFKELDEIDLVYSKVILSEVIEDALKELNIQNNKEIEVSCTYKNQELYGDKRILTRLFMELFKNSINDKNPDNKTLIIDISSIETIKNSFTEVSNRYQYDKFLRITYTDNGLGFAKKFYEIIHKSVEFNKINIGLAYSKQIVEKHQGSIAAKSVNGKGVHYTILMPVQPHDF